MSARLPLLLTRKHRALAYERVQLRARLTEVEKELRALDYALGVLDPDWKAPRKARKPKSRARLPHGRLTATCLKLLRQQPGLGAVELTNLVAEEHGLTFESDRERHDVASAITVSLRRYERKGLVEIASRDKATGALRWRIRPGPVQRASSIGAA